MKTHLLFVLGLSNRLKAFEKFLELHPGYIEKIVLLQVAVPSRTDVQEYIGKIDIDYFGIEMIVLFQNEDYYNTKCFYQFQYNIHIFRSQG